MQIIEAKAVTWQKWDSKCRRVPLQASGAPEHQHHHGDSDEGDVNNHADDNDGNDGEDDEYDQVSPWEDQGGPQEQGCQAESTPGLDKNYIDEDDDDDDDYAKEIIHIHDDNDDVNEDADDNNDHLVWSLFHHQESL